MDGRLIEWVGERLDAILGSAGVAFDHGAEAPSVLTTAEPDYFPGTVHQLAGTLILLLLHCLEAR